MMSSDQAIANSKVGFQLEFENLSDDPFTKSVTSVDLPRPDFFMRRKAPTPSPVFATYWRFAKLRQDAYFARVFHSQRIEPTEDPILRRYRFTNVYRAADRVSQYLIRHVLYDDDRSFPDQFFRVLVFKFFNKIETWEILSQNLGDISWDSYNFEHYDNILSHALETGRAIYSPAYIMPSGRTAYGYARKHRNHLKIIESMMVDQIPEILLQQLDFESVYRALRRYPCIGPFVGYQYACDLNYSRHLNFSENDFVEPGPGALDGISKCFLDLGDFTPGDIIHYMTDVQEVAFERFAPGFESLWGRPLHLIDCQNIFCEVGKYARLAHPEFEGRSNRTRIKQTFRPSRRPVERPWFPPKWGINELITADPRW